MLEETLIFIAGFIITLLILKYWYKIFGVLWILIFFKKANDFYKEISQLNTPFKAQAYMDVFFKYQKDKVFSDYWKEALKTWRDGYGDCEDWALFAAYCLRHLNPLIFCMYNNKSGHATCLISHDKYFETVGTQGYVIHHHTDYKKLAKHFYFDFTSYSLYTWDGNFIEHNYNIGGI